MKNHNVKYSLILISLLITPLKTWADDDNPFFDMPVVLSASRLEQPISQTPVSITSIDRQTIEASGARTIPEVLRLVPGMVIGYSADENGTEARQVVAYHGHTDQFSKQMQVLIDGRSIYEPILGGVAWNMLPINIDDIERIEVSRGPNASSYGSNSFLAVINIITRHASEDQGHLFKTSIGNQHIRDLTYRYGGKHNDVDYRITMTRQADDGLDARFYKSANPFQEVDNHDDRNARSVDYRVDYQINNNSQLTYQGGYGDTRLQINENFANSGIRPIRDSKTINLNHFLKYENIKDSNNSFVIQYYYNLIKKDDLSVSKVVTIPPVDPFTIPLDFGLHAQRHNLEFTHFNKKNESLRLVWGLSAQQDIGKSPFWLGQENEKNIEFRREIYRAFSNIEWHLNNHNTINAGALLEHGETTGYDLSPRLSLIHKLNINHSFRVGVSRAIRNPFLSEEFGYTEFTHQPTIGGIPVPGTIREIQAIPNNNIDNESIISREIAYYGSFLDNELNLNVRIFKDTLSDLIDSINVPAATDTLDGVAKQQLNFNSTTTRGIEIEFDMQANDSLRIIGSTAYLDITGRNIPWTEPERTDSLSRAKILKNSAPRYTASLLTIKEFESLFSASMGVYYVDNIAWPGFVTSGSNNYTAVDLKLSKKINFYGDSAKISLVLKNLHEDYSSMDPAPDNGPLVENNFTGYLEFELKLK